MPTKHTILIADDEDSLREALSDVVEKAGYTVVEAEDGAQAISLIQQQHFDLVLLDINMPKKNGLDVLRFIREKFPNIIVVMLTAQADLKHAMEAKELGAVDFITKPFSVDDVMETLRELLKT